MPRVALTTLGCKVNQVETEAMEGLFAQRGYTVVPFTEAADVYVVNTCSVTSFGARKSRQIIRRALRLNPQAVVAVTGCYAQTAPEEIKAIEGVKVVLGTRKRLHIVDYVEQAMAEGRLVDGVTDIMKADTFEDIPIFTMPERTRAFLKIQEGCQNFCTYCIIPYARGPLRSRPMDSIVAEAKKLLAGGFKEIVLTGIHIGAYGRDLDTGEDLADVAENLLKLPELKRLRLGSLESIELSEHLFSLLRQDKRFCCHLHLPLQAGSDYVLKRMNRHYNREEFARLLEGVRRAVPGVAVSTDIIVGFPGETEELFAESLQYIEGLEFARIHVFPYSQRQGTPAAAFPNQIPENVKKERVHRLQQVADRCSEKFHREFLGQTKDVIFETTEKGITDGLTDNYIRVYTDAAVVSGEMYQVELQSIYRDGMWGRVIK